MAVERLYIENNYIPLTQGLNPSITKAITDVSEPEKRKATFTKTVSIPRSKEADKLFSAIFEVNIINHTFNVQSKASCVYTVDDNVILRGYLKLNEIRVTDFNDIVYDVTMNSATANFWERIRTGYLRDLYNTTASPYFSAYSGLDKYDHTFTEEIQAYSWATQVWYDGAFIPFDYGTGYVYPLIDYGYSQDATNFTVGQMPCAIYVREYLKKIISWAGFEYNSTWIDGTICEHLIIPASPSNYALTTSEIEDREFVANTPKFASNNTTKTANLSKNVYGSNDQLIFTNDSVAPGTDPGLNYDPATGVFTCVSAGYYDLNILCDLQVEFKPDTANNVKTRCEVDGSLIIGYTPNGSVVESQVNSIPFYITYDDSAGFISGTRTTQASPTYPETDYLQNKSWSVYPNTSLTARTASVPNRYHLVVNNIYLIPGDEIRAYHKTGVFAQTGTFGVGYPTTGFFVDNGGTYYTGNAKLMCSVGAFYTKCVNTSMAYGNTLSMEKIIPDKVKMMDFFTSILKMFNLWVDIDESDPFTLIVEQREDFYGSDVLNIHELIDRSKEMQHIPMGSLDVRAFHYKYKSDKDYWNQKYETSYAGEIYGNREVNTTTDWYTQEKTTEVIFSPTPLVGLPNNDRVIPTIYQLNDNNLPIVTQHNIRILYYGGLKSCSQTWNHIHYTQGWPYLPLTDVYSTYPYAGHFDDPYTPTLDINFGLVKEVYYDDNIQTITATNNNLVNAYHSDFLGAVTDEDSRIVRAYVHLTPAQYLNFKFDKLYYFDYAYFRLQKIEGYNPTSEETTLCEFLKLTSIPAFTSGSIIADGAPQDFPASGGGGGVILDERAPLKGTQTSQQPDGNNVVPKSAIVIGEGNTVWSGAKQVEVNGYGNIVESNTVNIKIQGDNNVITSGVENVTLINTSDITVTESNVTYVDGKLQGNWPTETANFTADVVYEGYFIDCAGGNVTVTISDREEKAQWTFKRIDTSGNTLTLSPTGLTIDGSATQVLLPYECITIKWNNDLEEFSIVD